MLSGEGLVVQSAVDVCRDDGARAVVMGSTAMTVTDGMIAAGDGVPLCTSANRALRVTEGL